MGHVANVLPLIFLFIGVGIVAFVGYVVYSIVQDIKSQTQKKMEKKNVMFSRDGMKVGVKQINDEEYKDKNQRYVMELSELLEEKGEFCRRDGMLIYVFSTVSSLISGTILHSQPTRVDCGAMDQMDQRTRRSRTDCIDITSRENYLTSKSNSLSCLATSTWQLTAGP